MVQAFSIAVAVFAIASSVSAAPAPKHHAHHRRSLEEQLAPEHVARQLSELSAPGEVLDARSPKHHAHHRRSLEDQLAPNHVARQLSEISAPGEVLDARSPKHHAHHRRAFEDQLAPNHVARQLSELSAPGEVLDARSPKHHALHPRALKGRLAPKHVARQLSELSAAGEVLEARSPSPRKPTVRKVPGGRAGTLSNRIASLAGRKRPHLPIRARPEFLAASRAKAAAPLQLRDVEESELQSRSLEEGPVGQVYVRDEDGFLYVRELDSEELGSALEARSPGRHGTGGSARRLSHREYDEMEVEGREFDEALLDELD